jgi:hypothetical protein
MGPFELALSRILISACLITGGGGTTMSMTPAPQMPSSAWQTIGADARDVIRAYRREITVEGDVAATRPIDLASVPEPLMRLFSEYQASHPESELTPVFLLSLDAAGQSLAGYGDLPGDNEMVLLNITETVASASIVRVYTHVLIAAAGEPAGEAGEGGGRPGGE